MPTNFNNEIQSVLISALMQQLAENKKCKNET